MHPIIALWSHPRSMSTAMERIMRERGDLRCFHEPFMYDYYVHRLVRRMPHFDVQPDHPVSYDAVRAMLLGAAEQGPVFLKDMSYYVMPRILDDPVLAPRLTNCFLIRNPVASIPSYFKLDPDVTLDEIGLEAQWRQFDGLAKLSTTLPTVLCAEDVRASPQSMTRALWDAIGLPFKAHAFDWGEKQPDDWNQVSGWHEQVSASGGIRSADDADANELRQKFDALADKHPAMRQYLDHHLPFYEKLRSAAIAPA